MKLTVERVVLPFTARLEYDGKRRGSRAELLREAREMIVGQSIAGASVVHGCYSVEVVSMGKPRRKR